MKAFIHMASSAATLALLLSACAPQAPQSESLRPARTVPLHYDTAQQVNRYFGSVQARHEVDQGFRVAGKVLERRVEVGQTVREGDVLARLDDTDYRIAEEAARQQLEAAKARSRQAESDWQRLQALKSDGSVSDSDEEHAQSTLLTARAAAETQARQLELARNQVSYAVLHASSGGVVTRASLEVGQVVATGQPVIQIANQAEPEIVADIPEADLDSFRSARYTASLASAPDVKFEVVLRELSAQAAAQTRTYRARLKPGTSRHLPLGATATLVSEHTIAGPPLASIPAAAITQSQGRPALWTARPVGKDAGTVHLAPVTIHGYRNDVVLVSGLPEGTLVVTAGVQKMAPGLRVALASLGSASYVSQVSP